MTDNANQMYRGAGERPKLRCPVCSTMVELPAETCPKCRTNLRTGYTPPDNGLFARGRLIFGGLVLLLVLVAAVAVLFFNTEEPYQTPAASPASTPVRTDFSDAVDTVQSIAEGTAAIGGNAAQAGPILDNTRAVAGQAQKKTDMANDIATMDANE